MPSARIAAVLLTILLALPAFGQDDAAPETPGTAAAEATPATPPAGLDSPQSTIRTFVNAMTSGRTAEAVRCLDASEVDPAAAGYLADFLLDTMGRIEHIDPNGYPSSLTLSEGQTSWTFFPFELDPRHRDILETLRPVGQIVLVEGSDGGWRFSTETVAGISELRDDLADLSPSTVHISPRSVPVLIDNYLHKNFPALSGKFVGVKYWQWLGLLLLIFIGVAIDLFVRLALVLIARRIIGRRGGEARPQTLKKAVRPFGLAAAALFWVFTVVLIAPTPEVVKILLLAARFFWMLAAVWAAWRVTDLVGEIVETRALASENKFDDLLVPLVRKAIKIFIAAFGLIYIAGSLQIDIKPLLTGLGIGGVGFAFAAKDTIENFFGSITVVIDRPFEVGDWVTIGETEGTVEELGLRSVRIRTFYNSLVTIPTANLVRASVDNYGRRKYRRWTTHLNLTYDTTPEKIEAYCEGLRELVRLHPYTRKDYYQVWLHKFGPHSLDVLVYLFFEAPDWQTELRERHRFMIDAIRLAHRLGVEFAFPTQTLHVVQGESEDPGPPPPGDGRHGETEAQRAGRQVVRELTADESWRRHKPPPYRFRHAGDGDRDDDDETQIESRVGGDA